MDLAFLFAMLLLTSPCISFPSAQFTAMSDQVTFIREVSINENGL